MTKIKRHNFTRKQRMDRFQHWNAICWFCEKRIDIWHRVKFEIHHIVEFELTQDNRIKNTPPAHIGCHKEYTANHSIPVIAKSNRQRSKHDAHLRRMARKGADCCDEPHELRRGAMPGSKDSRFKRRMNQKTEIRT